MPGRGRSHRPTAAHFRFPSPSTCQPRRAVKPSVPLWPTSSAGYVHVVHAPMAVHAARTRGKSCPSAQAVSIASGRRTDSFQTLDEEVGPEWARGGSPTLATLEAVVRAARCALSPHRSPRRATLQCTAPPPAGRGRRRTTAQLIRAYLSTHVIGPRAREQTRDDPAESEGPPTTGARGRAGGGYSTSSCCSHEHR